MTNLIIDIKSFNGAISTRSKEGSLLLNKENWSKIRELMGLSQEELSKSMGFSFESVQDFESGQREIPYYAIFKLKKVFEKLNNG